MCQIITITDRDGKVIGTAFQCTCDPDDRLGRLMDEESQRQRLADEDFPASLERTFDVDAFLEAEADRGILEPEDLPQKVGTLLDVSDDGQVYLDNFDDDGDDDGEESDIELQW